MRSFSSSSRIGFRSSLSTPPITGHATSQELAAPASNPALHEAHHASIKACETVRASVEMAIMDRQEAVNRNNQPIHAAIESAGQANERAIQPYAAREDEARNLREQAHASAATKMGLAGGRHDRSNPDPEAPFRPHLMTREDAIHQLGLSDSKTPAPWAKWIGTVLLAIPVGSLFALSIGIKAGLMDPEITLNLEPDRIGPFIVMILLGIGLALIVGLCLEAATKFAAEQRNKWGWVWQTWAALAAAGVLFMVLTLGDALLQMTGLMSVAGAMTLSEETLPWAVFFIISLVITLPYMALKSYHGIAEGLKKSCDMKSAQFIENQAALDGQHRRNDPVCQEASAAVSHAMNADKRHAEALAERKGLEKEQAETMDSLRRQLLPISADPTLEEQLSIREAELRVLAAQADLEEGGPSFRGDLFRRQADALARQRASLR